MFGAILKATNSSFQKDMTFCRRIYVKKVMKLRAFIFEQPSYFQFNSSTNTLNRSYNISRFSFIVHSSSSTDYVLSSNTKIIVQMLFCPLLSTTSLVSRCCCAHYCLQLVWYPDVVLPTIVYNLSLVSRCCSAHYCLQPEFGIQMLFCPGVTIVYNQFGIQMFFHFGKCSKIWNTFLSFLFSNKMSDIRIGMYKMILVCLVV